MHSIQYRPVRGRDAARVLRLLDVPGDGYGPTATAGLEPLVTRLIDEQGMRGPAMERRAAAPRGAGELAAVALTGFVDLSLGRRWLTAPPPHLTDHVLACESSGDRVLLRPDEVATRNAGEGLALVFLAFRGPDGDAPTRNHVITAMLDSFRLFHAGYHCPVMLHPRGLSASGDETLVRVGFRALDDERRVWGLELRDLEAAPFNMLIALNRRPPPRFGFSPAEKEQLFTAMTGATDVELASELGISVETVRKRWRSIYERVSADDEPSLFPRADGDDAKRGPEKRTILLQYLDHHLEELRPYERR
jgi:DNA-binding CsgD family transcriptional regulator